MFPERDEETRHARCANATREARPVEPDLAPCAPAGVRRRGGRRRRPDQRCGKPARCGARLKRSRTNGFDFRPATNTIALINVKYGKGSEVVISYKRFVWLP